MAPNTRALGGISVSSGGMPRVIPRNPVFKTNFGSNKRRKTHKRRSRREHTVLKRRSRREHTVLKRRSRREHTVLKRSKARSKRTKRSKNKK